MRSSPFIHRLDGHWSFPGYKTTQDWTLLPRCTEVKDLSTSHSTYVL